MKPRAFISQLDEASLVAAIADAEKKTSGEIRVFLSHRKPDDAVAAAQRAFDHLGMAKTREHNGVLIFVAPKARKFAVIGDAGVHQRCGDEFWKAWRRRCPGTSEKRSSPPASFTASARRANFSRAISRAGPAT